MSGSVLSHDAPNIGAPAGGDRFAVGVDDLGGALQHAVGVGDTGDGGDRVDELGGNRVACAWPASLCVAEGERGAHLQVGVREGVAEQRVEARAHAVGEHERADDERHAEDDGDGDGDQPADAGAHAAARQEEGGVGAHRQSPIRFTRSSTVSGGRGEQLVDDLAVVEEHDPIGVRRGVRIVGDHHDRLPVLADGAAHEVEDLGAGPGVEVAGRLVGEDHVGPGVERAGDGDALLLAAGQLARAVAQPIGEADGADDLVEPLRVRPTGRRASAAG